MLAPLVKAWRMRQSASLFCSLPLTFCTTVLMSTPAPDAHERPFRTIERIFFGKRCSSDLRQRAVVVFLRQMIFRICARWRIGADDHEVIACRERLVASAGGD